MDKRKTLDDNTKRWTIAKFPRTYREQAYFPTPALSGSGQRVKSVEPLSLSRDYPAPLFLEANSYYPLFLFLSRHFDKVFDEIVLFCTWRNFQLQENGKSFSENTDNGGIFLGYNPKMLKINTCSVNTSDRLRQASSWGSWNLSKSRETSCMFPSQGRKSLHMVQRYWAFCKEQSGKNAVIMESDVGELCGGEQKWHRQKKQKLRKEPNTHREKVQESHPDRYAFLQEAL